MPNVQTVKPVESAGSSKLIQVRAFDSPKVPIKKKADAQINTIKRIDDIAISNRLQKLDVKTIGRKKVRIKIRLSRRRKREMAESTINHDVHLYNF